jgi:hypothetical protein
MESKDDYKERTRLSSPDEADSFILTFSVKLARRDRNLDVPLGVDRDTSIHDYDAYAY